MSFFPSGVVGRKGLIFYRDEVPEDLFSTVFPNGFHGAMV